MEIDCTAYQSEEMQQTKQGVNTNREICFFAICTASRSVRQSYQLCCFSLTVPDAPPESLKAWNLSSTSLHIQWDPIPFEHRNGKILRYVVSINSKELTRKRLKATKYTESTSLTIKGLQKYSKYVVSVSGITRLGVGPVRTKVVQTDEDGKKVKS